MKQILIIPLMLLLLVSSSYAATASIDKMFEVMEMDKQFNSGFEAMLPMIDQMAVQLKLDSAAKEELLSIYRIWFQEDIDHSHVMEKMKELYANDFTEDEIEEITNFYQTPTGQKFLEKSQELMRLGAQVGMAEAESKQTKLLERLKPFIEKHHIK